MANKATHRTDRNTISRFEQIINIGPAMSRDFKRLGFERPQDLIGQAPLAMYQEICKLEQKFHDPCVLDTYMATVDYMNGGRPRQWWDCTAKRKQQFSAEVEELRNKYA
jgi:hypothetical protein